MKLSHRLFLYVAAAWFAVAAGGCRSVSYTDQSGRRLEIHSLGTSAGIAKASVKTPDGGELSIEGYTSDASKALDVANKALSALPK